MWSLKSGLGRGSFVCGSTGLIDDVIEGLGKLGLATPGMVHSEDFSIFDWETRCDPRPESCSC